MSDKTQSKNKKTRRLPKAVIITVIVILALLLAVLMAAGAMFYRYYRLLNVKQPPSDSSIRYDESALAGLDSAPETVPDDDPDNPYNRDNPDSPFYTGSETRKPDQPDDTSTPSGDETTSAGGSAAPVTDPPAPPAEDIVKKKGVINVLLIGADYQTRYGNSDAIVVVSINNVDRKITLTSIMRDTEVYFPGIQNGQAVTWRDKISNAHAFGGPQLLINAIENNYGIMINNYAEVHYDEFIKVFDAIGGVDIVMDAEEVEAFNFESGSKIPADSAGKSVHLTAEQVLSYVRMRHLSGSDFGRTKRHRAVLMAVFSKMKTMSVAELDGLLTTLLPIVETDLSMTDCLSYVASAASYAKYSVGTFRFPMDGRYTYERNNLCIRGYNKTFTINAWRQAVAG